MGSHTKRVWDEAIALHFGVSLAPRMLLLRDLPQIPSDGRSLLFGYRSGQCLWVDQVLYRTEHQGARIKPPYFLLPSTVRKRLTEKRYTWWYWLTTTQLYPLRQSRVEELLEDFHFVDALYSTTKTLALFDHPEDPLLR